MPNLSLAQHHKQLLDLLFPAQSLGMQGGGFIVVLAIQGLFGGFGEFLFVLFHKLFEYFILGYEVVLNVCILY